LDVGCGTGKVSISIARQLPMAYVTGIDYFHGVSGTSPVQPTLNAELENVSDRISFIPGNLLNIPFPDNTFDVVTAGSVLHEVHGDEQRLQAVREIKRVLKPGGIFVNVEMLRNSRMKVAFLLFSAVWSPKTYWTNLLKQAGFQNLKVKEYNKFITLGVFFCEKPSQENS